MALGITFDFEFLRNSISENLRGYNISPFILSSVSLIISILLLTVQCRPQVPQEQDMYGPTMSLDSIAFPDPAIRPFTTEKDSVGKIIDM